MSKHTSINISGRISLNGRRIFFSVGGPPVLPLGEILRNCSVELLLQFSCVNKFDTNDPIKVEICKPCYDFCFGKYGLFLTSHLFDGAFLEKLKDHKLQCFCINDFVLQSMLSNCYPSKWCKARSFQWSLEFAILNFVTSILNFLINSIIHNMDKLQF